MQGGWLQAVNIYLGCPTLVSGIGYQSSRTVVAFELGLQAMFD